MIRSTGVFLQTADFTAYYVARYRSRHLNQGLLHLRDEQGDLPILKEWKTAKALLLRFKSEAQRAITGGKPVELGKAWVEQLPGMSATPWTIEEDDYAQAHVRTRTCLIISPGALSLSGMEREMLGVGIVNVIEHRVLHSEINVSEFPRTHLIVDVKRPEPDDDAED